MLNGPEDKSSVEVRVIRGGEARVRRRSRGGGRGRAPTRAAGTGVERFGRRGTEPFEPFEPFEFIQNRNFP